MTVEAVFKTTDAEVVAAWDKAQADWQTYRDAVNAFAARYPDHKVLCLNTGEGRERIIGLAGDPNSPPEGPWRWTLKARFVPDKRSNAGKQLAVELNKLAYAPPPFPGQPALIIDHANSRWLSAGFKFLDGVVFAEWGCTFELVEKQTGFDSTIWERAKLSEFYAAVEAAEEGVKANG